MIEIYFLFKIKWFVLVNKFKKTVSLKTPKIEFNWMFD